MLKFAILLSILFNNAYAYAGFIAPIARQAYAGSGLTDEQIFEDERMWSVKKQTNIMKMLENPEKKPSDPEVMPGVIKSKISTENLFSYCHGRVFKREQVNLIDENAMPPLPFRNEKPENLPTLIITENKFRSK